MRSMSPALSDKLMSGRVQPALKLYTWQNTVEISAIISGTAGAGFDITPYVSSVTWDMETLAVTMADPNGIFHPDYGEFGEYVKNNCVIRLKEGDARVSETEWVNTFTGHITGQPGWKRNRETGLLSSSFSAYNRQNNQAYQNRLLTSKKYTKGTDIGICMWDICQNILQMDVAELRVPQLHGYYFAHKVNQLVQISPWDAIKSILEIGCNVPFFDGDGRLASYSKDVNRTPAWQLPDWAEVLEEEIPEENAEPYNYVEVIYLNPLTTQVDGADQKLGTAEVTTGFFTFQEKLKCYWSEDRKQRAKDTRMVVLKSVNDNLLPVGQESYQEDDEYSGTITISISVWVPLLATAMLAEYLALAAVADGTESTSSNKIPTVLTGSDLALTCATAPGPVTGVIYIPPASVTSTEDTGFTIPWGRIGQAQAMIVILAIMMSLGSAQYEIWGTPYDMVYEEMRVIALEDGLPYWKEKRMKIENDFIGDQGRAEDIAIKELTYQHGLSMPRLLKTINNPALEIGDIIRTPWGQRFFITGLSKSYTFGETVVLEITGFKIEGA
jgi:hypothetical protein